MAIPFLTKEKEQNKERKIVPEKAAVTPAKVSETDNVAKSTDFVGRLLQELFGVYLTLSSGRSPNGVVRTRKPKNENASITVPALTFTPAFIRCHDVEPPLGELPRLAESSEQNPIETTENDITPKLSLGSKITIDLRRIGDTFESQNSSSSTLTRHPNGNYGQDDKEISLELELQLPFLIPATLLSLLSLALWKSRLS